MCANGFQDGEVSDIEMSVPKKISPFRAKPCSRDVRPGRCEFAVPNGVGWGVYGRPDGVVWKFGIAGVIAPSR